MPRYNPEDPNRDRYMAAEQEELDKKRAQKTADKKAEEGEWQDVDVDQAA